MSFPSDLEIARKAELKPLTDIAKEVSNKELWTELDHLNNEFEISWNWVKAHSNNKLNNEVDLIAKEASKN